MSPCALPAAGAAEAAAPSSSSQEQPAVQLAKGPIPAPLAARLWPPDGQELLSEGEEDEGRTSPAPGLVEEDGERSSGGRGEGEESMSQPRQPQQGEGVTHSNSKSAGLSGAGAGATGGHTDLSSAPHSGQCAEEEQKGEGGREQAEQVSAPGPAPTANPAMAPPIQPPAEGGSDTADEVSRITQLALTRVFGPASCTLAVPGEKSCCVIMPVDGGCLFEFVVCLLCMTYSFLVVIFIMIPYFIIIIIIITTNTNTTI